MVTLATVLAAIQTASALTPELIALFQQVKTLFDANDQATIDATLAELDARADAAHEQAQSL